MERSESLRPSRLSLDATIVALVAAASLVLDVSRLGFYGDDWDVLSLFSFSADQSIRGLYASLVQEPQMLMRPGQKLLDVLLYRAFGLDPLWYHLVNAGLLMAAAALLLLVLRKIGLPRKVALATAIVYALLPHYSTARVWYASIQAPFSMAAFLLSVYAGLRGIEREDRAAFAWQGVSLACLVASTLAYEVALPLFLVSPFLFAYRQRQLGVSGSRRASWTLGALTIAAALAVAGFKAFTSTRLSGGPTLFYLSATARQLARINLWIYGLAAPRTLLIALRSASGAILIIAAVLGIVTSWVLLRSERAPEPAQPRLWLRFVFAGVVVFILGHAVFLTTNVGFSPTGANNRTAIVGAAGVALVIVGAVGWLAEQVPPHWRRSCFAGLIGIVSAGAFVINAVLVHDWAAAYAREQEVLRGIRGRFPTLPAGTTIILDGICRYVGPAIVFESPWDLQGALRIFYRDSTLRGDVVSPDLRVEPDGLHTVIYGDDSSYPYDRLLIFDARRAESYPISDEPAARSYFEHINPDRSNGCPPARAGHGVQVF